MAACAFVASRASSGSDPYFVTATDLEPALSLSRDDGCLSCQHGLELGILLPHLAGVIVEKAELGAAWLCIRARARAEAAACPACGTTSGRVHSRYGRRLADVAIGGPVLILLTVRRFFCANPGCARTTFAEQGCWTGGTVSYVRAVR